MSNSFAPRTRAPPGSPQVGHLLHILQLDEYMELMTEEEVDLPVLAQMTEEQLQRLGVRRMGQRMRLLAAARNAFSNEEEDDRGDSVDISQPETENDNENHDLPEANENAINQGATEDIIHSQQQQTTTTTEVTESEEVQFQLIAKTTTTGKKSHIFKVGNYKYLGRGIKKNGLSFFYCNHPGCTSFFRVRYFNLLNPLEEYPEIESEPGPHILKDGSHHVEDRAKRLREDVHEKVKIAINQDPLRPVKEIHEDALNEVLRGITDENDRLEFCQQMPTHRQCERTEYRYRNTLIPPNPPTARDIETDGIFTKNAETGINNIVFDDQGDEDWDRILALSHPKVNIQSNHKLLLS